MSIYSSYEVYPPEFDEEFDCEELCETCTFDCWKNMGDKV